MLGQDKASAGCARLTADIVAVKESARRYRRRLNNVKWVMKAGTVVVDKTPKEDLVATTESVSRIQ
jgi:hypothetical protein